MKPSKSDGDRKKEFLFSLFFVLVFFGFVRFFFQGFVFFLLVLYCYVFICKDKMHVSFCVLVSFGLSIIHFLVSR